MESGKERHSSHFVLSTSFRLSFSFLSLFLTFSFSMCARNTSVDHLPFFYFALVGILSDHKGASVSLHLSLCIRYVFSLSLSLSLLHFLCPLRIVGVVCHLFSCVSLALPSILAQFTRDGCIMEMQYTICFTLICSFAFSHCAFVFDLFSLFLPQRIESSL